MRAIVTGADQPIGAAVVAGLRTGGAAVAALDLAIADRQATGDGVSGAVTALGGLDLLVITGWAAAGLRPVAFEGLGDDDFAAIWEGGMQGMLWTLQSAIPALRAAAGAVVVVLPTTGMTGGARYAVAAATFEGQRILLKAAVRQLGPEGIRVNAIAVAAELVLTDAAIAGVHYLAPPAIAEAPEAADVTDVVDFLVSPAGRHLSGQTITIDGGRWLAP